MRPLERAALEVEASRLAVVHNKVLVVFYDRHRVMQSQFLDDCQFNSPSCELIHLCEPLSSAEDMAINGPHIGFKDVAISTANCDAKEADAMQAVWETRYGRFFSTHANLRCDIFGCKRVAEVGA